MSSGVTASDACKDICQAVKMNLKGKKKRRFAILKMSDDNKQIVVDEDRTGCDEVDEKHGKEHFDSIIQSLPEDDGRYIVYDYPYESSFGPASKVILVLWCPQNISIKKKMIYASSKDSLKKAFTDFGGEFQSDGPCDLDHSDIVQKLRKC